MPKDTKSSGYNKAPACESRSFVRKRKKVCILTHLLSCFGAIIPNREVKFICLPCLVLLCFSFLCFACFLGVSRFLVGIILILVTYFSFLAFRLLYYIVSYPYHITYLASISSYILLFLCLKECYASVYLPLSSLFMVTFDYEIR